MSPHVRDFAETILKRRTFIDNGLEVHNEFFEFTYALVFDHSDKAAGYLKWLKSVEALLDSEEREAPNKVSLQRLAKLAAGKAGKFFPPLKPPRDPEEDIPDGQFNERDAEPRRITDPRRLLGSGGVTSGTRDLGIDPNNTDFATIIRDSVRQGKPLIDHDAFPFWANEIELMSDRMIKLIRRIDNHISQNTKATALEAQNYLRSQRILVFIIAKAFWHSFPNRVNVLEIQTFAREIFVESRSGARLPLGNETHPYPGLTIDSTSAGAGEVPDRVKLLRDELREYPDVRSNLDAILKWQP